MGRAARRKQCPCRLAQSPSRRRPKSRMAFRCTPLLGALVLLLALLAPAPAAGAWAPPAVVDASTLTHKFMMGFQGWFATPCDKMGKGWSHWTRGGKTPGPDPETKGFLNFDSVSCAQVLPWRLPPS